MHIEQKKFLSSGFSVHIQDELNCFEPDDLVGDSLMIFFLVSIKRLYFLKKKTLQALCNFLIWKPLFFELKIGFHITNISNNQTLEVSTFFLSKNTLRWYYQLALVAASLLCFFSVDVVRICLFFSFFFHHRFIRKQYASYLFFKLQQINKNASECELSPQTELFFYYIWKTNLSSLFTGFQKLILRTGVQNLFQLCFFKCNPFWRGSMKTVKTGLKFCWEILSICSSLYKFYLVEVIWNENSFLAKPIVSIHFYVDVNLVAGN